jgi:hypothetical protein
MDKASFGGRGWNWPVAIEQYPEVGDVRECVWNR